MAYLEKNAQSKLGTRMTVVASWLTHVRLGRPGHFRVKQVLVWKKDASRAGGSNSGNCYWVLPMCQTSYAVHLHFPLQPWMSG